MSAGVDSQTLRAAVGARSPAPSRHGEGLGADPGGQFQGFPPAFPPFPLPIHLIFSRNNRARSSRGARGRGAAGDSGALVPPGAPGDHPGAAGSSGKCCLYASSSGNGAGRIPGAGGSNPIDHPREKQGAGHRDRFSASLRGNGGTGKEFSMLPQGNWDDFGFDSSRIRQLFHSRV